MDRETVDSLEEGRAFQRILQGAKRGEVLDCWQSGGVPCGAELGPPSHRPSREGFQRMSGFSIAPKKMLFKNSRDVPSQNDLKLGSSP